MAAEPQGKCKTEPESRRPVFVAALVIIAGQAWIAHGPGHVETELLRLRLRVAHELHCLLSYGRHALLEMGEAVTGVESVLSFETLAVIVACAVNFAHA